MPRRFTVAGRLGRVTVALFASACVLSSFGGGASTEEDEAKPDVREMGFSQNVMMKEGRSNAAGSYFILFFTSLIAVGVLFKNSKRTHLD